MITAEITIDACRSCGGKDLFLFLPMGRQPLANALLGADDLDKPEPRFGLDLALCRSCSLVQILQTVSPEVLFRDYIYFTSFSETMLKHAAEVAAGLMRDRNLGPKSLVAELASNDGYLLQHFVKAGVPVLGIEPARNIARVAEEKGVRTVSEFFCADLAKKLAAEGLKADVILANNVMAHIPDINSVAAGLKLLLKPGGVFIMETPYVKDMIDHLEFDTNYHEHFFCHSLTALENLFRRHGLATQAVEWIPLHGGTIRVSVVHAGEEGDRPTAAKLLAEEKSWGVSDEPFYQDFASRVGKLQAEFVETMKRLKSEGKSVAAYGAAAKASTLLNYMGIGSDQIAFVVDKSTHKQGRYMPGTHIPVFAPERLLQDQPDYVVILAWNLAEEIMSQQAEYRKRGGKFIIPLPKVRVV